MTHDEAVAKFNEMSLQLAELFQTWDDSRAARCNNHEYDKSLQKYIWPQIRRLQLKQNQLRQRFNICAIRTGTKYRHVYMRVTIFRGA